MNWKWRQRCLAAYMAGMAACGGAYAAETFTFTPYDGKNAVPYVSTTTGALSVNDAANGNWSAAPFTSGANIDIAGTTGQAHLTITGNGDFSLGTITNKGNAANTLTFEPDSGKTLTVSGIAGFSTTNVNSGTLNIVGESVELQSLVIDKGTVNWSGNNAKVTNGTSVDSGASLIVAGDSAEFSADFGIYGGSKVTFNGAGAAIKCDAAVSNGTLNVNGDNTAFSSNLDISGGTVNISGSGTAVTGNAAVSGNGALNISGNGTAFNSKLNISGGAVNISGTGTSVTGGTAISGGVLNINGGGNSLGNTTLSGGELTINAATALNLSEQSGGISNINAVTTFTGGTALSGGMMYVRSALTPAGTLTVSGGGQLSLAFTAANETTPLVDGTVAFANGNDGLQVAGNGGIAGRTYKLIKKTSGLTADATLQSCLTADTYAVHYELLLADAELLCQTSFNHTPGEAAKNASDRQMAEVILNNTGNPRMQDVMSALSGIGSEQAMADALTQLNAVNVMSASIGAQSVRASNYQLGTLFTQAFSNAVIASNMAAISPVVAARDSARAAAGGTPVTYGNTGDDCAPRWTGFVDLSGGFGSQDGKDGASDYDFRGVGLMAGLERVFAPEFSLGALFGWSRNYAVIDHDFGEALDDTLRLGVYGNYKWDKIFVLSAPSVGIHMLETERNIKFMNATAKGDRTGLDFNWYNQVGATVEVPYGFFVTPSYALAMTYMHDPSYDERNAGGANLRMGDVDTWSLAQTLQVKVGRPIALCGGTVLLPEIWGGWEHEYLSANDASAAFVATPSDSWRVEVSDISKDRAVLGAGLGTLISRKYEVSGKYQAKLWDGGCSHNFTLGFGVKF